ncbi:MAG TPA: LysM peptidoglycan-binding domain-containing protein [Inquilinus sp.]|nr:LysM peptidoglycan-binding domain-containing protein [Inquilinus sp.]
MSYRIDDTARNRYARNGGTPTPLPQDKAQAFQKALAEALRHRSEAGGPGALQPGHDRVFVADNDDSLWRIAQDNNVSYADLLAANRRTDMPVSGQIYPGEIIFVPSVAPEKAAATPEDGKGVPAGEAGFVNDLYDRGNALEYADQPQTVDYPRETADIKADVQTYLESLPAAQRQDAALRLTGQDWRDAGPAGTAVTDAVRAEGLQTDAGTVVADRLYAKGNQLEYADDPSSIDYPHETDVLTGQVQTYLDTLPPGDRQQAVQQLYDRDWRDAGPAQTAIEVAAKRENLTLAPTTHAGPDVEQAARAITTRAQAAGTPDARYKVLADAYAGASPQVRAALQQGDAGKAILDGAAQWAVDGLKDVDKAAGDAVPELQLMQRLDQLTAGTDKTLATRLMTAAVPKIEAANQDSLHGPTGTQLQTGPDGARLLMQVTSRIAGTPDGDAAIQRLAQIGFYDRDAVRNAIGAGENPAYALALADGGGTQVFQDDVLAGVDQFRGQVGRDIDAADKNRLELDWRSANYQGAMTPDQLDSAVAAFKRDNPDWETKQAALDQAVATDGEKLLTQIQALQSLPPGLAGQQGAADARVRQILDDPKAMRAMQQAMQANPGMLDSPATQATIGSLARLSDRGRKLAEEAATQWARRALSDALNPTASGQPQNIAQVKATITRFETTGARILGMSDVDVRKATALLQGALPQPGETEADVQRRLSTLDQKLEQLVSREGIKSFGRREKLGQLFRGIGFAAAAVTLTQSAPKAFADPNVRNVLKASADAAGLSQKSIELMSAVGILGDDNKAVKLLGGSDRPLVKGLGVFGAIFDLANAGDAFERGDVPSGTLYLASATGTVIAALGTGTMAGPVGLTIVVASVIGQMVWGQISKVRESNRFMNDTSAEFLRFAGFDDGPAHALVDQSGEGYSPVPLLVKYAEVKGYDLTKPDQQKAFTDWINAMPADRLATLRDNIHHTLDAAKGDVGKFGKTDAGDSGYADVNHRPSVNAGRGGTVSQPSVADRIRDGDAAPASAAQLDIALGVLGLATLPQR